MSIGTKINTLRTRKGESLQKVADAINVSKTHVWELEKGLSKNPSFELINALADYFKVTVAYLVGEDPNSNDEDQQLVRMFRQVKNLDDRDKQVIEALIETMRRNSKL